MWHIRLLTYILLYYRFICYMLYELWYQLISLEDNTTTEEWIVQLSLVFN